MKMKITYIKLRDGSWGLKGPADMVTGDVVKVTKRDGTSKAEDVGKILVRGADYAIAEIAPAPFKPKAKARTSNPYAADERRIARLRKTGRGAEADREEFDLY
jgi:hypothetical protein